MKINKTAAIVEIDRYGKVRVMCDTKRLHYNSQFPTLLVKERVVSVLLS